MGDNDVRFAIILKILSYMSIAIQSILWMDRTKLQNYDKLCKYVKKYVITYAEAAMRACVDEFRVFLSEYMVIGLHYLYLCYFLLVNVCHFQKCYLDTHRN